MRIKGIGIISKEKAMEILTREGRKAVRDGEITTEELGEMYKLQKQAHPPVKTFLFYYSLAQ